MTQILNAHTFSYPLTIREGHLDTFLHVNNATYLQILEEARWEIIANRGYGLDDIKRRGIGPVLLEVHIKFRKELKLREKIVIETKCTSVENKITRLTQEIKNEDGKVCCSALITIAVFDIKTRKIIPLPQDWLSALGVSAHSDSES